MLAKALPHNTFNAVARHGGLNIPLCNGQPKSGEVFIIFPAEQGQVLIPRFAGAGENLLELSGSG